MHKIRSTYKIMDYHHFVVLLFNYILLTIHSNPIAHPIEYKNIEGGLHKRIIVENFLKLISDKPVK